GPYGAPRSRLLAPTLRRSVGPSGAFSERAAQGEERRAAARSEAERRKDTHPRRVLFDFGAALEQLHRGGGAERGEGRSEADGHQLRGDVVAAVDATA